MDEVLCNWEENPKKGKDWYFVSCINSNINPWKVAKKRNITLVELFMRCPFCGKRVNPIFKK